MDIASLVLGIIGLVLNFIPCGAYLAIILCLVGLVLGIVAIVLKSKAQQPKGMAITGTVLSAVGLLLPFFAGAAVASMFL